MRKVDPAPSSPTLGRTPEVVLYVEDEDDNWEVAHMRLGRSYELIRAATDRDACDIFRERGQSLNAILMDIQLKGSVLDGIQLTQLVRGHLPLEGLPSYARDVPVLKTPLIFVTAYDSMYSEADLVAVGGDILLPKPVNFMTMTVALRNLMGVER